MSDVDTRRRDAAAVPLAAGVETARMLVRPEAAMRDEEGSFGRALAAAREARGLTRSDVAAHLRLQLRQVKAIEEEDLAALPEGPFVRGFVRNYARLVDLPAEPLLSLLNAKLRPTEPLQAPASGSKAFSPIQRLPHEPMAGRLAIGGAVLALIVFAVFGWWTMRPQQHTEPAARTEAAPAAAAAAPSSSSTVSTMPAAAAPAAASSGPAQEAAAAAPDAVLRLSFRDRAWAEVRQADGQVLLSQNNEAGTVKTIQGLPPYTLVIGNASKVDLEFRGEPVDLAPSSSRDDVARLRLQ